MANESTAQRAGIGLGLAGISDVEVVQTAARWRSDGHAAVLATVLETWGSAPRPAGSHLAVRDDGVFVGSVSGGCVEGSVIEVAQRLMGTGRAQIEEYGVNTSDAWEAGLACGGTIRVGVSDLREATNDLLEYQTLSARRTPTALSLCFDGSRPAVQFSARSAWGEALVTAAERGVLLTKPGPGSAVFQRVYPAPLRVFVIGAVHIARALIPMATIAGHEVIVVDPRRAFSAKAVWGDTPIVHDYPDEAFASLGLDRSCAVVALSHDPKIDDPGLEAALRSEAFYIGALGSKRSHRMRLERLAALGFTPDQLTRVHGPVGLDIGAATPAEIAVSILAEMTAALHGRSTGRELRE